MIDKAFWPIFGEMKILEEITEFDLKKCEAENNCPTEYGIIFSYISLMFYMIFANILLLNLLIAMFRLVDFFKIVQINLNGLLNFLILSSTFSRLHNKNDEIWKFQRLKLVLEYVDISLIPPPPFIPGIIAYLMKGKNELECYNFTQKEPELESSIFTQKEPEFYQKEIECIQDKKYAHMYLKNEKYSFNEKAETRLNLLSNK